jgi:hypothetical protein
MGCWHWLHRIAVARTINHPYIASEAHRQSQTLPRKELEEKPVNFLSVHASDLEAAPRK